MAVVRIKEDFPLPLQGGACTRTAVVDGLADYEAYCKLSKTKGSAYVDMWYLRTAFGLRGTPGPSISVECLEDVTTATVARFLQEISILRHLKGKTVNRYREVLHRLFNWHIRQRGMVLPSGRNPISWVEKFRERRVSPRFLMLDDIERQLSVLEDGPVWCVSVAILIYAGVRRSELLWLTPADVDLHAGPYGTIRIRSKEIDGQFWQPKTGVERAVPVSSQLRPYLDRYEAAAVRGRTWYVHSPQGKRWDADNFTHRLAKRNKAAGLGWTCLDYRHTFGSQLAMKGESLYKISTLMGNSPEICRRHYAALLPESLHDTVEFPRKPAKGG